MQCHKWLWIVFNDKDRIPEPDKVAEHKFKTGTIIGVLATKVFSDGIDLSELDFKENIDKTKESLGLRKPIFEAGLLEGDLYSRGDILLPVGIDEWDIIEVKSATEVKDINVHDVAFQKYVYEKAGLKIRKCFLMHINSEYVKSGQIEPDELFIQADITEEVSTAIQGIEERISEMFKMIKSKTCPDFKVDDLKTIKYDNIAKDEFLDSLPKENVFQLSRGGVKSRNLYKDGIILIKDIPASQKLTDNQKIQKQCAVSKEVNLNKEKLKEFLDGLKYPLYYLDFESINPALPMFDNMKPYRQICFQYSLHIVKKKGDEPKHISFLADGIDNPLPKFLQSLKENLGDKGDIIVYYQGFEKSRLKEGAELFPEFEEIVNKNWLPRVKDLYVPFSKFHFYDPQQNGSASIKKVLPVMSNLSYKELAISNGADASLEYERVTFGSVSEKEKKKVREELEKYCELDTLAEIKIVDRLMEIVDDKN